MKTNDGVKEPRRTFSVCPACLARVPARLIDRNGVVSLEKRCDRHGDFSAVVWRGPPDRSAWIGQTPPISMDENPDCPHACGLKGSLCAAHRQDTCCVLLEVTQRCDLACAYCFAAAGGQSTDPPLAQLYAAIDGIARSGGTFLQFSGGEPALRDDLPLLIRHAKAAGCEFVQLNSNGLRLARDPAYLDSLAQAGLSFVFLQFDGLDDAVYQRLRGRPLFGEKLRAIAACGERNIGVTLVPTLAPGVNTEQIGSLARFGVEHSPVVRGVHFQPVSYFGRYPAPPHDSARLTLPEVYQALFAQADDLLPADSIAPSHCDHAACGFHGGYIVKPDGSLMALTAANPAAAQACCSGSPAARNRRFVGSRWLRAAKDDISTPATRAGCCDLTDLDGFLARARTHAFTISAMAFQDAWTLDLERLRQCSLHVYTDGALKPFCAHYLSCA